MERDQRSMYIMYTDKMTKKKLKPLILLLQSAYMFQFYFLQGKMSCKLLQTHKCMDIGVPKLNELWDSCVEFL